MASSSLKERAWAAGAAITRALGWLAPTLARLTVGIVFIQTGWGKLHGLDKVTAFFTELHIPHPALQARIASFFEFAGGLAMLAGLFTRLACLPLSVIMIVAIATAKRGDISGFTDLVGLQEWDYLIFCLIVLVSGPGPLSLDRILQRALPNKKAPGRSVKV